MRPTRCAAVLTALAVAVVAARGPLAAQDGAAAARSAASAADTVSLTLEEALRIAESRNPAYRRAVNALDLNAVETRATWANQVLPRASLDLFNTNYTGNIQRIGLDPLGNPLENPEAQWVYYSGTTQALSLNWSFQGKSVLNAARRQERSNQDRVLEEDASLTTARTQVRRQFYDVLEQRELLGVEETIASSRRVDLDLSQRLFRLARNSRVDVLQAELQIEQQELNLQEQRNGYEQARLALRTLLGDADLPPFRLADEPLPVFDPAELDPDGLVAEALEAHPDTRRARSGVEGARLGVGESRTAWWPQVNLGYSISRRSQTAETQALFDVSFDEDLDQNFYVSLSLPFFNDYFGNRRNIEQARVDLENQRESLREARLRVEEEVRVALADLRSQFESLRLARRSLEIAREALELARSEYEIGTRTFEQLQVTVQAEADARRQVIAARYGFVDALLNLEDAVGAPVRGEAPLTP